MATYAIGDVQGCYLTLRSLLERVKFSEKNDELWFAGDLVNRGANSLQVLRFVRHLRERATVVLGNHDLHLIAVAEGERSLRPEDTLLECLSHPDSEGLIAWLRQQPFVHACSRRNVCMVHAGLPPQWDLNTCLARSRLAQRWFAGGEKTPSRGVGYDLSETSWELLSGELRVRLVLDYFTLMRVCDASGKLNLLFKGRAEHSPPGFLPWFAHAARQTAQHRLVFGHWAALRGEPNTPKLQALDTGCAWGDRLTALRLDDWQRFSCPLHSGDQPASSDRS